MYYFIWILLWIHLDSYTGNYGDKKAATTVAILYLCFFGLVDFFPTIQDRKIPFQEEFDMIPVIEYVPVDHWFYFFVYICDYGWVVLEPWYGHVPKGKYKKITFAF